MKFSAFTLLLFTAASIASPATACADEPVPTVDQVVAVMTKLTDPAIAYSGI
ncbi:hypothetical protein [Mycobacterium sp.]|uniref:hypothetical protein n=1 Tax=Mycobacterium sp. TaxID=1785 RepID=UPI003D12991F